MPSAACRIAAVSLALALAIPAAGAQSALDKLPQDVTNMLKSQIWWDSAAPSKTNPRGLKMEFTRIDQVTREGRQYARYRVHLAGAPVGERFTLQAWKIGAALKDMVTISTGVYVNAKGLLMTRMPGPGQENLDAAFNDGEVELDVRAARGEPCRFVLVNDKRDFLVTGTVVPWPVESRFGACRIEARLATPEGEVILVYADGLPPNADIAYRSNSEGESRASTFRSDARGHGVTVDLPFVVGKDSGALQFAIAMPGCTPSLEIPWGKGSYRPQ